MNNLSSQVVRCVDVHLVLYFILVMPFLWCNVVIRIAHNIQHMASVFFHVVPECLPLKKINSLFILSPLPHNFLLWTFVCLFITAKYCCKILCMIIENTLNYLIPTFFSWSVFCVVLKFRFWTPWLFLVPSLITFYFFTWNCINCLASHKPNSIQIIMTLFALFLCIYYFSALCHQQI